LDIFDDDYLLNFANLSIDKNNNDNQNFQRSHFSRKLIFPEMDAQKDEILGKFYSTLNVNLVIQIVIKFRSHRLAPSKFWAVL
jgi:hypothetical protein